MPPRGKALASSNLTIYFNPYRPRAPPLTVPVVTVERETCDRSSYSFGTRGTQYQLDTDRFSLSENMLVEWASSQMRSEDGGFQSALDHLVMSFMDSSRPDILPQSDLLQKVHKLRCLYKVWSQTEFVCQRQQGCNLEPLPRELGLVLKAMSAKLIKGIENDVLGELAGRRPKMAADRLALWACMMQIVLLYHDLITIVSSQEPWIHKDLQQKAENLLNYAAVMCDLHFGKKKPTSAKEHGIYVQEYFDRAERMQLKFFMDLRQQDRRSDHVLVALLAKNQKCATRSRMTPPHKRLRK
jgi:hypothetical protein